MIESVEISRNKVGGNALSKRRFFKPVIFYFFVAPAFETFLGDSSHRHSHSPGRSNSRLMGNSSQNLQSIMSTGQ